MLPLCARYVIIHASQALAGALLKKREASFCFSKASKDLTKNFAMLKRPSEAISQSNFKGFLTASDSYRSLQSFCINRVESLKSSESSESARQFASYHSLNSPNFLNFSSEDKTHQ